MTAVPPEVMAKHPSIKIRLVNGYAYAVGLGRRVSIAELVWNINHPDYPLRKGKRIFHIDGDKLNNHHTNLTTNRQLIRG